MENYINENVELKKRLESLEANNKNLLQQLQKMQTSLATGGGGSLNPVSAAQCFNNMPETGNMNINSANQFGTLLMVLVLFFTVLLGVWSPVLTKDQISHVSATAATTAAAAASAAVSSSCGNRSPSNAISFSAAASATTTAAVAVASLAVASSVAQVKGESLLSATSGDLNEPNEDEFLASNDSALLLLSSQSQTVRSKAGTAVELTKVRPFIRNKIPSMQSVAGEEATPQPTPPPPPPIVILNLGLNSSAKISETPSQKPNTNSLITLGGISTNATNFRVINTIGAASQQQQQANTSAGKLPTRFRLINNGITSFNSHIVPSVIKLNTLA